MEIKLAVTAQLICSFIMHMQIACFLMRGLIYRLSNNIPLELILLSKGHELVSRFNMFTTSVGSSDEYKLLSCPSGNR